MKRRFLYEKKIFLWKEGCFMERRLFYEKRIVLWKEDCFIGYKLSNPFRLYRNLYE